MDKLETIIRNILREKGTIPFRDFMELALYYPEQGYYQREKIPFGKSGDFYTSPGVHSVFGETIARDLLQKWNELGSPSPYKIVEYGAGQGTLARDTLNGIESMAPDIFSILDYRILEISPYLRRIQEGVLTDKGVKWMTDLHELGPFSGIVLSNELIDAAPVHIIVQGEEGPQEVYVTEEDGQLVECMGPISNERIFEYLQEFVTPLELGQRVEVNLAALDWLYQLTRCLQAGFVITIDYGDEAQILYEGRMNGTLRGFREHQLSSNPFDAPGDQDLTADVNFTALMKYGEHLGLETVFYGTQSKFLIQAGIFESLSAESGLDPFRNQGFKRNLAIKHLIMPGGMGERFKVLVQRKIGS